MNKKLSSLVFVLALVGSGPVLLAQSDTISDFDVLTSGVLEQELMDEIDDLFYELRFAQDGMYPSDQLKRAILFALSDERDDDNEDDVDYAELQREMGEAGTSVEDLVDAAIQEVAQSSYLQESPSSPIVLARSTGNTPWNASLMLAMWGRNARSGTAACKVVNNAVGKSLPGKPYQPRCNY